MEQTRNFFQNLLLIVEVWSTSTSGHASSMLQRMVSKLSSLEQGKPPDVGWIWTGRLRRCVPGPGPQVTLQLDQAPHDDQTQSWGRLAAGTETKWKKLKPGKWQRRMDTHHILKL